MNSADPRQADAFQRDVSSLVEDDPVRAGLCLALVYWTKDESVIARMADTLENTVKLVGPVGGFQRKEARVFLDIHHAIKRIPAKTGRLDRTCRRRAQAIESLLLPIASPTTRADYLSKRNAIAGH